jgi:hypothetical protein
VGTSRTVAQFTGKIDKIAKELSRSDREILEGAGKLAKTTILVDVRRVVPDLRMSMGGRNGKVNVRSDFDIRESRPQVTVKAVGPLHLVENDTSRHLIIPRGLGTRRTAAAALDRLSGPGSGRGMFRASRRTTIRGGKEAKQALKIPGVGPRGYATHPGTKGQHPYAKGRDRAAPKVAGYIGHSTVRVVYEVLS